jgi:hypothetical protein
VRDAIARNQSRMQLAGLVGPPLGGVLLGVGRALPFVADAVSYLVSLVGVLFVRSSLLDPPARRSKRRIAGEVLDGVRWLWRRPFFRGVLVWMTLEGAAFSSIGLVILVLARERGATSAQLGAMFAITSGGGVLGALAAPWFLRHASVRSARRRSSCHRRWAGSSSRRSRSSARTSCWDAPTARRSSSRASPRRSGR